MSSDGDRQADAIVAEYDAKKRLYDDFRQQCERLVRQLLGEAELATKVLSVTSRAKKAGSLKRKVAAADHSYGALGDVTDLAGVRVITYFADDVDHVASVLQREFNVDEANSTDKRKVLAPDAFGYLSLHYICRLSDARAALSEYARFADVCCEIQIRSILQHAWAEIEHDLGYKTVAAVPADARRRFSRLAGLLEIADEEFKRLRDDLALYASSVTGQIARSPSSVLLDKDSLMGFLAEDARARELDRALSEISEAELNEQLDDAYVGNLVPVLLATHLTSIADIQNALLENSSLVIQEWKLVREERHPSDPRPPLFRGVGLFRLCLVISARRGGAPQVMLLMKQAGRSSGSKQHNEKFASATAESVQRALKMDR